MPRHTLHPDWAARIARLSEPPVARRDAIVQHHLQSSPQEFAALVEHHLTQPDVPPAERLLSATLAGLHLPPPPEPAPEPAPQPAPDLTHEPIHDFAPNHEL